MDFVKETDKKEELNLYDWLSATNSPRQTSDAHNEVFPAASKINTVTSEDLPCKLLLTKFD